MDDLAPLILRPVVGVPAAAHGAPKVHSRPVPWVDPADVANAVCFLASAEDCSVSGEAIDVAAGFGARWHARNRTTSALRGTVLSEAPFLGVGCQHRRGGMAFGGVYDCAATRSGRPDALPFN